MNDFSTWVQSNWYAVGNLLVQSTFLAVGVWFARKIVKTLRRSQEQIGALLKLSVTDSLSEPSRENGAVTHRPTPYVMADWPTAAAPAPEASASEASPLSLPEPESGHSLFAGAIHWLQMPMASGGPAPWRKVVHWLQTPAGTKVH